MPAKTRERNRGPAAAADNRRALLQAARTLFTERGYRVPLSIIAKEAGVGQGVLYRHFRSRLDLAFAVFEDNFTELAAIAAELDDRTFFRLWDRLLDFTIKDTAFIEMTIDARHSMPQYAGAERLREVLEPALSRARAAGLVDPRLTADDVLLAQRMAHGLVVTSDVPADVRATVTYAFAALAEKWPRGRVNTTEPLA